MSRGHSDKQPLFSGDSNLCRVDKNYTAYLLCSLETQALLLMSLASDSSDLNIMALPSALPLIFRSDLWMFPAITEVGLSFLDFRPPVFSFFILNDFAVFYFLISLHR